MDDERTAICSSWCDRPKLIAFLAFDYLIYRVSFFSAVRQNRLTSKSNADSSRATHERWKVKLISARVKCTFVFIFIVAFSIRFCHFCDKVDSFCVASSLALRNRFRNHLTQVDARMLSVIRNTCVRSSFATFFASIFFSSALPNLNSLLTFHSHDKQRKLFCIENENFLMWFLFRFTRQVCSIWCCFLCRLSRIVCVDFSL